MHCNLENIWMSAWKQQFLKTMCSQFSAVVKVVLWIYTVHVEFVAVKGLVVDFILYARTNIIKMLKIKICFFHETLLSFIFYFARGGGRESPGQLCCCCWLVGHLPWSVCFLLWRRRSPGWIISTISPTLNWQSLSSNIFRRSGWHTESFHFMQILFLWTFFLKNVKKCCFYLTQTTQTECCFPNSV